MSNYDGRPTTSENIVLSLAPLVKKAAFIYTNQLKKIVNIFKAFNSIFLRSNNSKLAR